MITAIDSNVIVGLWNPDDALNPVARGALETAFAAGALVICGAVFGELVGCPGRNEDFVDDFVRDADIRVDWSSSEAIWRSAGLAYQKYAVRRRRQKTGDPRRILTDFYIGAHALHNGYALLTLDARIYRAAFSELKLIRI